MFTVALIGGDGAGKTTIAQKLIESYPLPIKYIYMGMNASASNFALPTMRVIEFLRPFLDRKAFKNRPQNQPAGTEYVEQELVQRGQVVALARLFIRLGEEWFRQCVSWTYLLKGYVVLFDRHFRFDHAPQQAETQHQRFSDRLHWWILNHLYPEPELVILLDAPPEVLFARKPEGTLADLRDRRIAYLEQGEKTPHFVCIDATQSVDRVYNQVIQSVARFHKERYPGATRALERF